MPNGWNLGWEIALTDNKGVRRVDYWVEVGIHNANITRKGGRVYGNGKWRVDYA